MLQTNSSSLQGLPNGTITYLLWVIQQQEDQIDICYYVNKIK